MAINNIAVGLSALIIADMEGSITREQKAHLAFMEKELPAVKAFSDHLRSKWDKDNFRELAIQRMKEINAARISNRRRKERWVVTAVIIFSCLLAYTIFHFYKV